MDRPLTSRRAFLGLLALPLLGSINTVPAAMVEVGATPSTEVDVLVARWSDWCATRQFHGQLRHAARSEA